MESQFTSGQIRRSIQRFRDYSDDLIQSDANSWKDRLNMLLDFCLKDEVFTIFHEQLITVKDVDFNQWFLEIRSTIGSASGSGSLRFPTDLDQRLSIMYQLLHYLRDHEDKMDLVNFSINFFALDTNQTTNYVIVFNKTVTQPLARELGYRLKDMLDCLLNDTSEKVSSSVIQNFFLHSNNIFQQKANVKVSSEIEGLFEKLKLAVVKEADSTSKQREYLEIVEAAKKEATAQKPKLSVLKALLSSLPTSMRP